MESFYFKFILELFAENRKIFKQIVGYEYWSCIYFISMNSSQQALQINGKLFFQISDSTFELTTLFKNNTGVRFRHARWGRHLCWSVCVLVSLCLPPSVMAGGILFSSSPTYFQLWYACHMSFERSLRVATFRNRYNLSVCTTIFKRIAGCCFYLKCLMLYINGFVSTSSTK